MALLSNAVLRPYSYYFHIHYIDTLNSANYYLPFYYLFHQLTFKLVVFLNNWDKWFGLFMTCFMTSIGSEFVGGEARSSHLCPRHEPFCHPLGRGVPEDTNCNSTEALSVVRLGLRGPPAP